MSRRADFVREHPAFPWLDVHDAAGVAAFLAARDWLMAGERVTGCERAGEGNMNLTLRVRTDRRTLVLKQARPWVEKYEHIPAPWERALSERWFYERVATLPAVAACVPRLLGADGESRTLLLEDLPSARDLTGVYGGDVLAADCVARLAGILRALHDGTAADPPRPGFNAEMRALNHQHLFMVPLAPDGGLALDRHEPGLAAAARRLAGDVAYRSVVSDTARRYLDHGGPLVHGDYFPGSWLATAAGLRVIDPEFCFQGEREIDVGCAVAHLVLGRQPPALARGFVAGYEGDRPACDGVLVARYAAVEVMRRLIGVAQLPIAPTDGWRAALLARARAATVAGTLAPLTELA